MQYNRLYLFGLIGFLFAMGCKDGKEVQISQKRITTGATLQYAKGFTLKQENSGLTIVTLTSPWANAKTSFTYALVPRSKVTSIAIDSSRFDAVITVPVRTLVVTSTTHIPALEALGVADRLIGFPNTDFISSEYTRKRIDAGHVQDLGTNEAMNTELTLKLRPDLVVGFGIDAENKTYGTLKRAKIPVVYNGDWTENSPLGKAEWLKFFAPFFGKEAKADHIFETIEKSYVDVKRLATEATERPTVLTGGLFKDVWYVAGGKSWMAQFLEDAHTDYLWRNNKETGSVSLSIESVLQQAQNAQFWLNPSMHTSMAQLKDANRHYQRFQAYEQKQVFSNAILKGPTGGLLFYEKGPSRPDLVLKDLIAIFHPYLMPGYEPHFFKPLR